MKCFENIKVLYRFNIMIYFSSKLVKIIFSEAQQRARPKTRKTHQCNFLTTEVTLDVNGSFCQETQTCSQYILPSSWKTGLVTRLPNTPALQGSGKDLALSPLPGSTPVTQDSGHVGFKAMWAGLTGTGSGSPVPSHKKASLLVFNSRRLQSAYLQKESPMQTARPQWEPFSKQSPLLFMWTTYAFLSNLNFW